MSKILRRRAFISYLPPPPGRFYLGPRVYCKPKLPRVVREWAKGVLSSLRNRPIAYFREGLILTTQKMNEATTPLAEDYLGGRRTGKKKVKRWYA